jgi:hypothetical protein
MSEPHVKGMVGSCGYGSRANAKDLISFQHYGCVFWSRKTQLGMYHRKLGKNCQNQRTKSKE